MVEGVDVGEALGRVVADPVELMAEEGYERLAALAADDQHTVSVPVDQLGIPLDLGSRHIATGLNFTAHAGEVAVDEGPFLFPKLVSPTAWNDPVPIGDALLDHEAEIAWVPLTPITGSAPAEVGLILVNDYTDRATLLELVDTDDVTSGDGFTTAKSAPGYLPVGNLFVVPRDPVAFVDDIVLRLYVNGELRQRGRPADLVWDLDTIVEQAHERRSLSWDHRGETVSLFGDDTDEIPARSLILAGTPEGTIYTDIDLPRRVEGFFRWLAFGWGRSIPDHAIDAYIDDARSAGIYLQPGDRITIQVDNLGVIDNRALA